MRGAQPGTDAALRRRRVLQQPAQQKGAERAASSGPRRAASPVASSGGEGGIRTRGRLLTYARLASGYLRPLGHLSRRVRAEKLPARHPPSRDKAKTPAGGRPARLPGWSGLRVPVAGTTIHWNMLLLRPEVNEPSAAAREKAVQLLERRLGPSRVLTGRDACERFAGDESEAEGRVPDAVVLAESRDDILAALAVAREAEVPLTPRAGGTGRTGGAVPVAGGIVLSVIGMSSIKEIDRARAGWPWSSPASCSGTCTRPSSRRAVLSARPQLAGGLRARRQRGRERRRAARVQVRRHARLRARPGGVPDRRAAHPGRAADAARASPATT